MSDLMNNQSLAPISAPGVSGKALGPGDQLVATSAVFVVNALCAKDALESVRGILLRHPASAFTPDSGALLTTRLVEWSAYREESASLRSELAEQEKLASPSSYRIEARKAEYPKPYYLNGDRIVYSLVSAQSGPITLEPHCWACHSLESEESLRLILTAFKERQELDAATGVSNQRGPSTRLAI